MTSRLASRSARWLKALVCGLAAANAWAQSVPAGSAIYVAAPNGYANIAADDMRVQTSQGLVSWMRVWDGQEWRFNPHWESLSQSWKNLTGSQSADTTGATTGAETGSAGGGGAAATLPAGYSATGGGGGCWVWVDEDWQPSYGTTMVGGLPQAEPVQPARLTPFNKVMGEDDASYAPLQRVSVDFASLCAGAAVAMPPANDVEGIRRNNELYLGEAGRYVFSNRAILEKRAVKAVRPVSADNLYASLAQGRIALAPQVNDKGYRWLDKAGDWIDYNTQGQVVAYGDRNDNTVWLARDTAGRLLGVVDNRGRVLYTLHYTGQLLTEVRDYPIAGLVGDLPARTVKYKYDERNRLVEVTDVRGHATQYAYNGQNRIVTVTDAQGRSESLSYTGDVVSRHVLADGAATDYVFEYDDVNKQFISKITGPQTPAGRRVEDLTHNRSGKLVRHLVNGRTEEEIRYDTGARAEITVNARGFASRVTRDEFDHIVEEVYPDGATIKRSYSALHLGLVEEVDELGFKARYQHDAKGNVLKKTEAAGTADERVTEYELDEQGQVTVMTRKGRTESDGAVTRDAVWRFEYDEQGHIARTVDPEGFVRRYVYDRAGNLISLTSPRGHTVRYEVDADGHLLKETNALGHVRTFAYDKVGNEVSATDARGKATLTAYDALNRPKMKTSPIGGIHQTQYNGQGMVVSEIDEDGRRNQTEYDNFLRITKQVDGLGNATAFGYQISDGSGSGMLGALIEPTQSDFPTFSQQGRYDALERLTSQSLKYRSSKGEQVATFGIGYDKRGQILTETDPDGFAITHRYDAFGQRIETVDAEGAKTTYRFDASGNLLEIKDALGHVHRFEYDRNDRLIKEIRPAGQSVQYQYDADGNMVLKVDERGNQHVYTVDAANRVTQIAQKSSDGTPLRTLTQTWDANGNPTGWSDTDHLRNQTSATLISYDDVGRKTGETITYPGGYSLSHGAGYSAAGKKTHIAWPDGTRILYGYSTHGELEQVTIPGEGIISFGEFGWLVPKSTTFPGGGTQSKSFDGLLKLETLNVKSPAQQNTLSLNNEYGRRPGLKARIRTDVAGSNRTLSESFDYDKAHRLTRVQSDSGGMLGTETESFTVDAVGNRIAHSRVQGAWTYDANNRLIKVGDGACGSDGVACYEWDDAGNLTRKSEAQGRKTRFQYDSLNRLAEVRDEAGNIVARYGYDPMDRRIWKELFRDRGHQTLSQATRTYYLYNDEGLLAEATQPISLNADGGVTESAPPRLTTQYGPKPDAEFTTGMLFVKARDSNDQERVAYFHHDHLQAPIQATDKSGNVVWVAEYNAFGRARITTPQASADKPTMSFDLRLPGQYEDDETGLHYNFRRYYDADTGRYVTSDPIGVDGGLNLYLYGLADPINLTDPTGECPPCAAAAAAAAAAARLCARFPRICKEILKCARNPRECFCKKILRAGAGHGRNRPVHWICDAYKKPKDGGPNGDSCFTATAKCFVGDACSFIRKVETNVCFGGKPHKPGNNDIEEQQRRANKECKRKRDNICRKERCKK